VFIKPNVVLLKGGIMKKKFKYVVQRNVVEVDVRIKKLTVQLEEHKKLTDLAQKMLMIQVLRFISEQEYVKLKQFCETYARD
jgi:hypothetical protein